GLALSPRRRRSVARGADGGGRERPLGGAVHGRSARPLRICAERVGRRVRELARRAPPEGCRRAGGRQRAAHRRRPGARRGGAANRAGGGAVARASAARGAAGAVRAWGGGRCGGGGGGGGGGGNGAPSGSLARPRLDRRARRIRRAGTGRVRRLVRDVSALGVAGGGPAWHLRRRGSAAAVHR